MAKDSGWEYESSEVKQVSSIETQKQAPQKGKECQIQNKLNAFDFAKIWNESKPADADHEYIRRKAGIADGLRVFRGNLKIADQDLDGALLVPAYDREGTLKSWQAIPAEKSGRKINAPSTPISGLRFTVGKPSNHDQIIYVCEGVGAAWATYQSTSSLSICCFGSGNMEGVALEIRKSNPSARIVIVSDRGKEQQSERISLVVNGCYFAMPPEYPDNADINDLKLERGVDAVTRLLAELKAPERRYLPLSLEELSFEQPLRWCIKNVLPAEGIAAIYGPSGSGKSFLALDLMLAVAEGNSWFGISTQKMPVTYLVLEGAAGLPQRVAAYRKYHGEISKNIRCVAKQFSLISSDDRKDLIEAIEAVGCKSGLVVIDTLNRAAAGADENSSRDMGQIIEGARQLQAELGGIVVLIHHSGKDQSKGLRGHSSLHAALDAVIEVNRNGKSRKWIAAKEKDAADSSMHSFRLDVIQVNVDEDGLPVSSCVVVPENVSGNPFQKLTFPQGANQQIVWSAINELLQDSKNHEKSSALFSTPYVQIEEVIDTCRDRVSCDESRKIERIKEAINSLSKKGVIAIKEKSLMLS
jgi:archaellum biogenesis ATPase FlaH